MSEQERFELEVEAAAREDYRWEAYGSEASMLAAIDADHAEAEYQAWLAGLESEERTAHLAKLAAEQAQLAAYHAAQAVADYDDVPF